MQKTYLLDTNILMVTNGSAIFGFEDNKVVITQTTLEELDGLKSTSGETGFEARESIRVINQIYEKITGNTVVDIGNKGSFAIIQDSNKGDLPPGWNPDKPDNRILRTVKWLEQNSAEPVVLITNDISMQIKAQTIGIAVQSYRNDQIDTKESTYAGREIVDIEPELVDEFYKCEVLDVGQVELEEYVENEFVMLKSESTGQAALGWVKSGDVRLIKDKKDLTYGLRPKNSGQRFALEALLAPASEIPLVILNGPAGCGKTLLAMAAALEKTYDDKKNRMYDRIIITRSNTLSDEDMGFLPSTLEDKMQPLLAPFFDNLSYLIGSMHEEELETTEMEIQDMLASRLIEICSLSYIRGRSLANSFIIIDEAQNLTRHQAKTIVTRAGIGTKVVFLGDTEQIDNPKLDKLSNGLVYLAEKFKGNELCAQLTFVEKESVRSKLASEAIKIL